MWCRTWRAPGLCTRRNSLRISASGKRIGNGMIAALMRVVRIACACSISASLHGTAQVSGDSGKFHWDSSKSQELTWTQRVTASKQLTEQDKKKLIDALAAQLHSHADETGIGSDKELYEAAAGTRIRFAQLSPEVSVIVAQGGGEKSGCSATGNCPFWVLRRGARGYTVLLEAQAQTFTIQPTKTNGLYDIVLSLHGSAFESQLTEYKFDGTKYAEGGCYLASWRYLGRDDEYHDSRVPRLSPCSPAANEEGRIALKVTDRTGAAISRAQVGVRPSPDTQTSAWRTDDSGRFSFVMPPGDYDLFVVGPLFKQWRKQVHVRKGKTLNFEIVLESADISQTVAAASHGPVDTDAIQVSPAPVPEFVVLSVKDQNGQPIAGAQVWVAYQDPSKYLETDEHGMITLSLIPRDYAIVVTSPGYSRWKQEVRVEKGRGRLLDAVLTQVRASE